MHYGTTERISVKFYEEACREIIHAEEEAVAADQESQQTSLDCNICDLSLIGERTLLKHLTLRHFPKVLCDDLPKKLPYRCPFIDCHQTRQNLHALMIHYGVDHNVSMELYLKHPKVRKVTNQGSSSSSAKVELPNTPRLAKLQAVVTPYQPEYDDKASPVPYSPTEMSGFPRNGARKSFTSDLRKIEELEEKIKQIESRHKERLKEKQSEFERWLASKESSIEEEKTRNKELGERLTQSEQSISDLNSQLELVHDNFSRVEEEYDKKNKAYDELSIVKQQFEVDIHEKENERINSYEELYNKEKELESLQDKLKETEELVLIVQSKESLVKEHSIALETERDKLKSEVSDANILLQSKDEEITAKNKEIKKINKELDKFSMDCPGIKMKITKDKGSLRSAKLQLNPELESLVQEKKDLSEVLVKVQASSEKKINEFKAQIKILKEQKLDQSSIKELEKEKKDLLKKVKILESTLSDWESRQFTNVKLISGLEKERDTLQLKLKEMKDGNLSHEDQLYWKDVAIKNCEKELKSVQAAQETSEKAISELTKELDDEKSTSDLYKTKCEEFERKSLEESVTKEQFDKIEKDLVNKTNEIQHLKITLGQRIKDYSRVNTTAVCQKKELDRLMEENERLESEYSQAIAQLETLKNSNLDLEKKVSAQNCEIQKLNSNNSVSTNDTKSLVGRRRLLMKKKEEENRVETLLMNQVLLDMDTVIKLRESGSSPEKGTQRNSVYRTV